jgi:hypothetical protein
MKIKENHKRIESDKDENNLKVKSIMSQRGRQHK